MSKKKKQKDLTKSTHRMVKIGFIAGTVMLGLGVAGGVAGIIGRNMIQQKKSEVYSVSFDLSGDMTKGKRGDAAVGMKAGINGAKNDFDHAYPWASIKQVTDENGDVFTRIPKFYEKYEFKEGTMTYSITSAPRKGFKTNVAFIQGEKEIPYIDIGSYEASIDKKGHLRSVSGVTPETDHTLDQYRVLAESSGNQLFDARGNQALQSLFLVEFATFDSQSVMSGATQYISCSQRLNAEDIEKRLMKTFEFSIGGRSLIAFNKNIEDRMNFIKANKKHATLEFSYKNSDDQAVQFKEKVNITALECDVEEGKVTVTLAEDVDISTVIQGMGGRNVYIHFGNCEIEKTGLTDGKKGSSRGASLASLESTAMNYRGVENWYGNTSTLCDGLAAYKDSDTEEKFICVSMDATKNGNRDSYERYAVEDMESSLFTESGFNLFRFNNTDIESHLYDDFYFNFCNDTYCFGYVGGQRELNATLWGAFGYSSFRTSDNNVTASTRLSCIPQTR